MTTLSVIFILISYDVKNDFMDANLLLDKHRALASITPQDKNSLVSDYIYDVKSERNLLIKDVELSVLPVNKSEAKLSEIIFDKTLSKEFKHEFKIKFGNNELEQFYYSKFY